MTTPEQQEMVVGADGEGGGRREGEEDAVAPSGQSGGTAAMKWTGPGNGSVVRDLLSRPAAFRPGTKAEQIEIVKYIPKDEGLYVP